MTLDQLQTLNIIVKTGSFRAASEELNKAQSAISYAIRNLEEELDIEIFSRDEYRPKLTDAGRAIYEHSLRVLSEASELTEKSKALASGVESEVSLIVNILFPTQYLVNALKAFKKIHPHTQVRLNTDIFGAEDKILNEDSDIALTSLSGAKSNQFDQRSITSVKLIPVASADHPLCQNNLRPTKKDLLKYNQIVIQSTDPSTQDRKAGVLEGANIWRVSDFVAKKEFLLAGLGWGSMPKHLVEAELKSGELKELQSNSFKSVELPFYLIRKSSKSHGPASSFLWEQLKNSFS